MHPRRPWPLRRAAFALALVVVLGLAAVASAGDQVPLSPLHGLSSDAQVASDGGDRELAVWTYDDGTHARRIQVGSLDGGVRTISPAAHNADSPRIALNRAGAGAIVWRYFTGSHFRIQASLVSADGTLSRPLSLSPADEDAGPPRVAIGKDGSAFFVWVYNDGSHTRVRARAINADRTAGPLQTVSGPGANATGADIATFFNGDGLVVWQRTGGEENRIQARPIDAEGGSGAVWTLTPPHGNAFDPEVAGSETGDPFAVWSSSDGTQRSIQAEPISHFGPGPVRTVSGTGASARVPQIAAEGTRAVAVWEIVEDPDTAPLTYRIQARSLTAAGERGDVLGLGTSGPESEQPSPQVAMNAGGDAVAVWQRTFSSGLGGPTYLVQARPISATDTLGDVSSPSLKSRRTPMQPQVASGADGFAGIAAWTFSTSTDSVIYGAGIDSGG